jgi:hypothetical protein
MCGMFLYQIYISWLEPHHKRACACKHVFTKFRLANLSLIMFSVCCYAGCHPVAGAESEWKFPCPSGLLLLWKFLWHFFYLCGGFFFFGWINVPELCALMKPCLRIWIVCADAWGTRPWVEDMRLKPANGSSRAVHGQRKDVISGGLLCSQSCLSLSALLLRMLFFFLLTWFCFVYMLRPCDWLTQYIFVPL